MHAIEETGGVTPGALGTRTERRRRWNWGFLHGVNARLELIDVCVTGFHFCRECQRITELAQCVCGICGSQRVVWHGAIVGREGKDGKGGPPEGGVPSRG